jgi:predicted HNH restriction endonuclease
MEVAYMAEASVRWRSSGGRGEWEVTPSGKLTGRTVVVRIDQLGLDLPSETYGDDNESQAKPRLRKFEQHNRKKLHLVPLVMAAARLADPARQDKLGGVEWPLRNKRFLVSEMRFEIAEDDGATAVLRPLYARILHAEDRVIDLQQRFQSVKDDIDRLPDIGADRPLLADAIREHRDAVMAGVNWISIRKAADGVIEHLAEEFGETNDASVTTIESLPKSDYEDDLDPDYKGKEGKVLTRLHTYRERDPELRKQAKGLFKAKHGKLFCECCGFDPGEFYGPRGEDRIQGHHRTPVTELLPDTVRRPQDLAMVCPNCHDIIHATKPWLTVEELRAQLLERGKHHFSGPVDGPGRGRHDQRSGRNQRWRII